MSVRVKGTAFWGFTVDIPGMTQEEFDEQPSYCQEEAVLCALEKQPGGLFLALDADAAIDIDATSELP